jgi:hypothetical protein
LATGTWPSQHGVVADSWYDRSARRVVRASDEALQATTLTAAVADDSRSRCYAISMDQVSAALFTGTPEVRLFWMDEQGQFATNGDTPGWLGTFNASTPPEKQRGAKWMALGAKPDAPPLRTLVYDPNRPHEFLSLYKSSPYGQAAQFDLLGELIDRENLGQGDTFDFVCLLAGASELLGYETGSDSPLMQQLVLQLDRRLESLLDQLGRAPGEGAFDVVLAGAHGSPPQPFDAARSRMAVNGEALAQAVEKALAGTSAGHVEKYVYPFLSLDVAASRDPEPVRMAAARVAMQHPAVAGWFSAGGGCSVHNAWETRFRNSFHSRRSGDLMLSYRPEYVEDYGPDRGVSYGSFYNYDIRVPLCFYGPQFRAGVFETPVESVDVAPTLARAMGVATPSSATGRVLGEAFAG